MQPPPERILLVDDDRALLEALVRQHRRHYELDTACGAEEALAKTASHGSYAVVVSDYQMPGMRGTELLGRVHEATPDTLTVMLSGQADLSAAIEAVNKGAIFRFLTKPCEREDFRRAVDSALEVWRLRHAERLLLEGTLRGAVEVLVEVLGFANPTAFGRAMRLRDLVRSIVRELAIDDAWQYETAALLSQIGCVAVPDDILAKAARGETLEPVHAEMLRRHPEVARRMLARVPRLEAIAQIIFHQDKDQPQPGEVSDRFVFFGSRILSAAIDYDNFVTGGLEPDQVLERMRLEGRRYTRNVVEALAQGVHRRVQTIALSHLCVGMIVEEDVHSTDGTLLASKGHCITESSLSRLRNHELLGRMTHKQLLVRLLGNEPAPDS